MGKIGLYYNLVCSHEFINKCHQKDVQCSASEHKKRGPNVSLEMKSKSLRVLSSGGIKSAELRRGRSLAILAREAPANPGAWEVLHPGTAPLARREWSFPPVPSREPPRGVLGGGSALSAPHRVLSLHQALFKHFARIGSFDLDPTTEVGTTLICAL